MANGLNGQTIKSAGSFTPIYSLSFVVVADDWGVGAGDYLLFEMGLNESILDGQTASVDGKPSLECTLEHTDI